MTARFGADLHRLAELDGNRIDDAVDRRADRRAVGLGLCRGERGLRAGDRRLERGQRIPRYVAGGDQLVLGVVVELRLLECRAAPALTLASAAFVGDGGDDVVGMHLVRPAPPSVR